MINIANNPDLVKDETVNAVLNTNATLLKEHKNKKLFFSSLAKEIDLIKQRLNILEQTQCRKE